MRTVGDQPYRRSMEWMKMKINRYVRVKKRPEGYIFEFFIGEKTKVRCGVL